MRFRRRLPLAAFIGLVALGGGVRLWMGGMTFHDRMFLAVVVGLVVGVGIRFMRPDSTERPRTAR